MIPDPNQPDGFTRDFDAMVERAAIEAQTETMGHLSLVTHPADPLRLDLQLNHTRDHIDCPGCRSANAALQLSAADLAAMTFDAAADAWMKLRRQSATLRERTHETTQGYINALSKFFGRLRLVDITPGHVRGYQIARLNNTLRIDGIERSDIQKNAVWQRAGGASTVNHEIAALGLMMRFATLWHRIKPYYFPLHVNGWSPRTILNEEQERELFLVAAKHPKAALAYHVALLTNNTGAAGQELRLLKLRHLFLTQQIGEIYIPPEAVKNNSRPRRIALNDSARFAVEELLKRAIKLGACEPDHYLFPLRLNREKRASGARHRDDYDPARPASRFFLRKSWAELQAVTGFRDLDPYDLRHHFATKLLENDVNIETARAIMGHVSPKMTEYYSHQRRAVKYAAVLAIEAPKKLPASERSAAARKQRA